jgi:RNA polymerase sigma-70 factor (ECF subfamily)
MLYFEEKDNEEIAEIVGITQNNVRVKMTRIREKLRTMLVKNE